MGAIALLVVVLLIAAAAYLYSTAIRPTSPVGFQQVAAVDPGHPIIPVAIWYPTNAKPGFVMLGLSGEHVASDGAVAGTSLPLVVISHGTGGGLMSHADTAIALAEKGFVVAAPMHPGDNFRDSSDVGKADWLPNRARQVQRVVDMMTRSWKDRAHLDPRKIGIFGFSAGATTALIAIGGTPDLSRIASQCAQHPEFVCQLTKPAEFQNVKPVSWPSDQRISAAVIAAPGLGFTFEPQGLSNVHAAIQLWSGGSDQTVPYSTNAGTVSRLLGNSAESHVVPGAVHYSFLMPCGLIGPPQLCRDPKGFDRAAFHKDFNDAVVKFFKTKLATSGHQRD